MNEAGGAESDARVLCDGTVLVEIEEAIEAADACLREGDADEAHAYVLSARDLTRRVRA